MVKVGDQTLSKTLAETLTKTLTKTLTERQEKLLSKYLDGECGALGRLQARRLMIRSAAAQAFAEDLRNVSGYARRWYDMQAYESVGRASLWDRVDQRIGQEQRASLYLGERTLAPVAKDRGWHLGWGLSGAALAAACLAFFILPFTGQDRNLDSVGGIYAKSATLDNQAGGVVPQVQTVSAGGVNIGDPLYSERGYSSQVEVDWLHSSGQVSLIPNKDRRAPIIWVKKPSPLTPQAQVFEGKNSTDIRILNESSPPYSFAGEE
ncbi:MAG: hypothetical protein GX589_04740 [Deltaproteobacteria bacterium]|nr:hypothetical protein [Deltaproteobacteria bacterium]